jgi:uncharacterized protein YdhG (YjbR/CyaY superfamily)
MGNQDADVDRYIARFPEETRRRMTQIRSIIHAEIPDVTETISWGMPTFKYRGTLVSFAAYKHHIGLYPLPDTIVAFRQELEGYRTSKGAIRFPLDKELPSRLVRNLVRYRFAGNKAISD